MLHPLAQDYLNRIVRDYDRETLWAFFRDFFLRIRELDAVCSRERRRCASQDDIERLDLPVMVAGTPFRRPSVAGMTWLRHCAAQWWGEDRRMFLLAFAYACAHRDKEGLESLWGKEAATRAVTDFFDRLDASEEAVAKAALALQPQDDDALKWFATPGAVDWVEGEYEPDLVSIALALSKKYGGTPQKWLWETSDDEFWGAFMDSIDETEADMGEKARDNPESWWRKHRHAILKCAEKLASDAARWKKERDEQAAARRAAFEARKERAEAAAAAAGGKAGEGREKGQEG